MINQAVGKINAWKTYQEYLQNVSETQGVFIGLFLKTSDKRPHHNWLCTFFFLRGEKFREAIINDVERNIEVVTQEREKLRKIVDENKVGLI